jgi:hypothetical protein
MKCPYCESEMVHEDSFGTLDYINGRNRDGKRGDIFYCPNRNGFENEETLTVYLNTIGESIESIGVDSWEEIECLNERGNGFYYCYVGEDILREGYPC